MAKLVTYRCPVCHGTFDFLHHPSDEPPPDHCQIASCGAYVGDDVEKQPVLSLNMRTEKNAIPDKVYRDMETASAGRAADAAEIAGASVADMSAMKITNMKDNTREGDQHAVVSVNPSVAAQNLSTQFAKPEMQNPQAAQWASETQAGPGALATRSMLQGIQASGKSRELMAAATQNGNMGRY